MHCVYYCHIQVVYYNYYYCHHFISVDKEDFSTKWKHRVKS